MDGAVFGRLLVQLLVGLSCDSQQDGVKQYGHRDAG